LKVPVYIKETIEGNTIFNCYTKIDSFIKGTISEDKL